MAVSSFTLSLLTEKINFLLLCQSFENYLNLAEIQPGFQKEFVFQHFLSSDRSLLQRAIKRCGRKLEAGSSDIYSFDSPESHIHKQSSNLWNLGYFIVLLMSSLLPSKNPSFNKL